ncbi:MAG: DUF3090 family protein [Acidimicrobiales bacterium]
MSRSFDMNEPGRFTAGALGEPGRRVFFFQVFADGIEAAVKCEKQQAQALAEHLVGLVERLPGPVPGPQLPAEPLPPAELEWVVGSISLGLDEERGRVVVLLEELLDPEEDDDLSALEPAVMRVALTPAQVLAYAAQVESLVAGSRPLCRLCERPIDPSGHACPRLN